MTPDQTRLLIDHLDESLQGKATAGMEELIANDPEAEKEWNYLRLAVDAIEDAGLHEQVAGARAAWEAERKAAGAATGTVTHMAADRKATGARVRSLNRYSLRVAACILVLAGSSALYKYLSVSSSSLYERYYGGYTLNTVRGAADADPIVEAYDAKDWTTVRNLAAAAKTRTNQTEFLAGMACLEQKQYDEAISHFEQIIAVNSHAGTAYFQDEAEYYLAISWLAHKNVNEAMPILERIKADPHHKYHDKVAKMSFFDLRLAQYKENK